MSKVKFSVFDHLDASGVGLAKQYKERLRLAKACESAGFYAYHVAEHHGTPHGIAPSPNLFLSALAQRTKRIRLGPLVMLLNLYHPLRAFEEICMLDQMSGGRLELGLGSGVMPVELGFYGVSEELARDRYDEATCIILKALAGGTLTHHGRHFDLQDVPITLSTLQRPTPPLWVGVTRPESAVMAADHGMNIACVGGPAAVRAVTDAFRARWRDRGEQDDALPELGMVRQVVIGDSDAAAQDIAASAYACWFDTFTDLFKLRGLPLPSMLPQTFEEAAEKGLSIAGSMSTVRDILSEQIEETGVNYILCQLAFGDLPLQASLRTAAAVGATIIPDYSNGSPCTFGMADELPNRLRIN